MDKDLGLFVNKYCKVHFDFRITSADSTDNFIVLGDDKGKLYSYEITDNDYNIDHCQEIIKNKKIDQIKCLSNLNVAFVLTGGIFHVYTVPKLEKILKFEKNKIEKFCANGMVDRQTEVILISKSKIVDYYEYSHTMRKLIEMKYDSMKVVDLPEVLEWYGDWICYVIKKKAHLLSVKGKFLKQDFDITYSKNVMGSWLIYCGGIGIFMDLNQPKQQNTIDFGQKPLVLITTYKNYVLSLHDSLLKIFDGCDSSNVQEVIFEYGFVGRFLSVGSKHVFYIIQSLENNSFQIYELKELAFQMQINKLLNDDKIEDALSILNYNIQSHDDKKPKKLEEFYLDCAWACLKKAEFTKAYMYAKLTNFNPMSFLYLFKNELKLSIGGGVGIGGNNNNSDIDLIKQLESNCCSIDSITDTNNNKTIDALKMLCNLLQDKRNYMISNYDFSNSNKLVNKKINFIKSDSSLINLDRYDFYVDSVLTIINTALIKVLVRLKSPSNSGTIGGNPSNRTSNPTTNTKSTKIFDVIDHEFFKFDKEDLKSFLIEEKSDEAKLAMALIHERLEDWEDALSIWRTFGLKTEANLRLAKEACERTKMILTKYKDKQLFHEYIQWILIKFHKQAFELFINTEIILVEHFFSTIIVSVDKDYSNLNLKEKFLEFYIEKGCTNERYHTILCDIYIEKLFKQKRPDTPVDNSIHEGNVKIYLERFTRVLKTSNYYNKTHILDKIKDSWLIDLEVYLYSQLNMHNEAISKLIAIGVGEENFDKVETYCLEVETTRGDLFGEMFKILANHYKTSISALSNYSINNPKVETERFMVERQANTYKKQMLNVLKKYGENPQLDPFMVIEVLPAEWTLTEQVLYDYLIKIMKTYNHMSNKYKIARSLSEMACLYKEKEIIEAKNKSVTISNDTYCELCKKKIGSTIFVVYPNMRIYHTKCSQNMSICPTTRVDFSKKSFL